MPFNCSNTIFSVSPDGCIHIRTKINEIFDAIQLFF